MSTKFRVGVGASLGLLVAAVDNLAFGGEVSPIVIVALLLAGSATLAAIGPGRTWPPAVAMWLFVPGAHLFKKVFDLPDTLHPNTYTSILMLAAFTAAITIAGTMLGRFIRGRRHSPPTEDH